MRAGICSSLFAACAASLTVAVAPPAAAANTYATNPLGFFYDNSFRHIEEFKHPTAMLVTGRCNRYHSHFAEARAAGAEVLAYLSFVEMTDTPVCALDTGFYTVGGGRPALWPFPSPGVRVDYPNNHMLDIRAGGAWADQVVAYIENLMREDKVDGVFLDVHGARLWSKNADWNNSISAAQAAADGLAPSPDWTQAERDAWTQGNVDLVRRLDESRRAINPRFIIVNNNTWDRGARDPLGTAGEQYVDGVCLEHHDINSYQQAYAGLPFGSGKHRRMLIIANSDAGAQDWTQIQGVTHVSNQTADDSYGSPPERPLPIGLNPLVDRQKLFGRVAAASIPSAGMGADRKRASRFTLSERGRLRELSAHLDGDGGASGQQTLKLVLYRDNNGAPGAKVAESNPRTFSAGATKAWYSFSLNAANTVLLQPGDYWIALFTSGTEQVLRNYGDGAANWFGNDDIYADGAADPFGAGNTGSVTLSVRGGYTLE
jgi:hypothetical protein